MRVCFDTCHTSDSGYDIIHHFDDVIEEFDRIIGKDQIAVFHINDSKNVPGAAKDRHENIGFGHIGFEAINYIVHHADFRDVPKILETPYIPSVENPKKSYAPYKYEIEMLRAGKFDPDMKERIVKEHEKSVPEKRQKTFRHAFLRPILIPSCSELTQNKNTIII